MCPLISCVEIIFVGLFGLVWGSFLNVCIYRLPKDLSIVTPGSFCPKCNKPINWYDNIPVFSYLILKGKCRNCKAVIAWRYPLVELLAGLLILVLYLRYGLTIEFARMAIFFSLLIVVSFIDIDYHAIPALLCFIGIVFGLTFSLHETATFLAKGFFDLGNLPLVTALKGLIFGFGFAYMFKFFGDFFVSFYLALRKKDSIEGETESLGLGDVDFLGMVGVFLGIKAAALVFFVAPFIAMVYALFAFIFKRSHLIPYLPYLSAATLVVYFWGGRLWNLIFNF